MDKNGTQKEPLRIVVFFRNHLVIGGVETYMYNQAKHLKENGWTVVWVRKHSFARFDQSFADVFGEENAVIWNRQIPLRAMKKLTGGKYAEIKVIAFNMYQFAQAEKFKKRFEDASVSTFLFMPHYKGEALFFEENHSGSRKEPVKYRMASIYRKMHGADNLRYFNIKHMEVTSANYGYQITDPERLFVPPRIPECTVCDLERCEKLATRERFNILTVTRFDFPHKDYLFGLIRAYAQLKERYPHIELTIIGYGVGQSRVEEAIDGLSEAARKDVHLIGKVSPDQLKEYYYDANLNVSVAGSCSQGAKLGVLSIPARHYNEACEVYGYYPESRLKTVAEEPGDPVAPYIENVLNMSPEVYISKCQAAFDTFNNDEINQRDSMGEIQNCSAEATLSVKDIAYITIQEMWREIHSKSRRIRIILQKYFK